MSDAVRNRGIAGEEGTEMKTFQYLEALLISIFIALVTVGTVDAEAIQTARDQDVKTPCGQV